MLRPRNLLGKLLGFVWMDFRETYRRIGISWDSWDWESDLVWDGSVSEVSDSLQNSLYYTTKEGALAFDVDVAAGIMECSLRNALVFQRNMSSHL